MSEANSKSAISCPRCNIEFSPRDSGPGRRPQYCSDRCRRRAGKARYKQRRRRGETTIVDKLCEGCARPMIGVYDHVRFCSYRCCYTSQYKLRVTACVVCGISLPRNRPGGGNRKTCSDACHKVRQRELDHLRHPPKPRQLRPVFKTVEEKRVHYRLRARSYYHAHREREVEKKRFRRNSIRAAKEILTGIEPAPAPKSAPVPMPLLPLPPRQPLTITCCDCGAQVTALASNRLRCVACSRRRRMACIQEWKAQWIAREGWKRGLWFWQVQMKIRDCVECGTFIPFRVRRCNRCRVLHQQRLMKQWRTNHPNYQREYKRDHYARRKAAPAEISVLVPLQCKRCGIQIQARRRHKKFCDECVLIRQREAAKSLRENGPKRPDRPKTPRIITCQDCSAQVRAYSANKKRCDACAQRAQRDYSRIRQQATKELSNARLRARYAANPEYYRAKHNAWRARNPDRVKEKRKRQTLIYRDKTNARRRRNDKHNTAILQAFRELGLLPTKGEIA